MLAQNFKSAADLNITEPQLDALRKTLVLLETGKLRHAHPDNYIVEDRRSEFSGNFNMGTWATENSCGTVACIGGTAELIGNVDFADYFKTPALFDLFEPRLIGGENWKFVTPAQAATALRSYLTTGDARWDLAVKS